MDFRVIQEVINQAYATFNRRDLEATIALMHPEVSWPNGWEGGFVEGHDGVRDYWTRQWKELDPEVIPMGMKELPDGRVEVDVQQTVRDKKGNLLGQGRVKHVYTLENGLITRMDIAGS